MYIPGPSTVYVESLEDPFHIYFLSDFHLKEKGCNESLLREHIDIIKNDPKSLVILGGDHASYICSGDKRLNYDDIDSGVNINSLSDWGNYLCSSLVDIIKPIQDKIVIALMGNHEYDYYKKNQHNIHKTFCDSLNIFNGGYSSVFSIRFCNPKGKKKNIIVHATHGSGSAATRTAKVSKLHKYGSQVANSDIVFVGHMHDQLSITEKYIYYKNGKNYHYKTIVCSGSYLESYKENATLYGERAGYFPPILGCVRLDIIPKDKTIQVKWMR